MTPNFDERIASIIRALTEVILPHLPPEAALAQEQTQLCIGQLQIMQAQLDAMSGFEREELDDAIAVGNALIAAIKDGGVATKNALTSLTSAINAADGSDVRQQRQTIYDAVEALVKAAADDGEEQPRATIMNVILEYEALRVQKDREWFAPFGFDTL